ncbi:MAG: tetraacyldisaccharide 4'-kinase [Bacteroidales bacterium]|nr:tetraacyldisaccharide 4'-kinase [Bacteroidales bacterium]
MKTFRIILSFILLPLSILYGVIIFFRNKFYDWGILPSRSFHIPLISVGNITVGGTGKTPHIEYLAELLKDEFKVATLSRGYKRKSRGFQLAGENSPSRQIGDEPKQIKQKHPDIAVAADGNRVRAIGQLQQKIPGLDLILLDDAFQHRKVDVNLSILLIDYQRPLSKDFMLPLGNLREQAFEKRRANIIIITKAPADMQPIHRRLFLGRLKPYPYQSVFFTTLEYGAPRPVFPESAGKQAEEKLHSNSSILLTTAIADPRPLKNYVRENHSKKIVSLKFADHKNFSEGDIKKIRQRFKRLEGDKIILTTEKDAIRFGEFADMPDALKQNFYFIPIRVKFLNDRTSDFNSQIIEYVRKNKKHSFLYPG